MIECLFIHVQSISGDLPEREGHALGAGAAPSRLQLQERPGGGVVEGHAGLRLAVVVHGRQWATQPHHLQNEPVGCSTESFKVHSYRECAFDCLDLTHTLHI